MNYNDTSDSNEEILADQRNQKSIATLENIFNSAGASNSDLSNDMFEGSFSKKDFMKSETSNEFSDVTFNAHDPLESTASISDVDLDQLREYSKMLHEHMDGEATDYSNGGESYGGRQKVLTTNKRANSYDDDIQQILSSFISCSILSFVTAAMGVGFILNLIIQIR